MAARSSPSVWKSRKSFVTVFYNIEVLSRPRTESTERLLSFVIQASWNNALFVLPFLVCLGMIEVLKGLLSVEDVEERNVLSIFIN